MASYQTSSVNQWVIKAAFILGGISLVYFGIQALSTHFHTTRFDDINSHKIDTIVITSATDRGTVQIHKVSGRWEANGVVADQEKIETLFRSLPSLASKTLLSDDPDKIALKWERKYRVTFMEKGQSEKLELKVYVTADDARYFQSEGKSDVYSAGSVLDSITTEVAPWKELSVFKFDSRDLKAIEIRTQGKTIEMTLNSLNVDWQLKVGSNVLDLPVQDLTKYFDLISNLSADDLLDLNLVKAKKYQSVIKVTLKDSVRELYFGDDDGRFCEAWEPEWRAYKLQSYYCAQLLEAPLEWAKTANPEEKPITTPF